MKVQTTPFRELLSQQGLRVTPQRMAILEAVHKIGNHPTADQITDFVRKAHPNIASGTVYHVLDTLVQHQLVKRVTTDRDVMRYDGIMESHHHLYCQECNDIQDYVDEELNALLQEYFKSKKIEGFEIKEFVLEIKGTFNKCKNL